MLELMMKYISYVRMREHLENETRLCYYYLIFRLWYDKSDGKALFLEPI